jgi:hypothetical protein
MTAVESWAMTALAYSTDRMISMASTLPWTVWDRDRHSEVDVVVDCGRRRRLIGGEENGAPCACVPP